MENNNVSARGGQNLRILDIGCGNGDNVCRLSKKGAEVIGIDLDVAQAQKKYPALKFLSMPAEKLEFADNNFDKIYAYDVLEHVENVDATLKEIFRVLKSGGTLIATIPHYRSEKILMRKNKNYWQEVGHRRLFNGGELESLLKRQGFIVEKRIQKSFFVFVLLWIMFTLGKHINSQKGDFDRTPLYIFLQTINQFFDAEITFTTKAKFIPIWIVTLPVAWLLNKILPKTVKIVARKSVE